MGLKLEDYKLMVSEVRKVTDLSWCGFRNRTW